jgi:hypothetical protein
MRDFVTIGNTKKDIIDKINTVQKEIIALQETHVQKGVIKERMRICAIMMGYNKDGEGAEAEERLGFILKLMEAIWE